MIDLNMPGGVYDPPKKRDIMSLKEAVASANAAFEDTEKVLAAEPQPTPKKSKEKEVAKEEVTEVENPNAALIDNLESDLVNFKTDITAVIKILNEAGNKKELEELKAENEALKKQLAAAEEKAKKFDALKSMFG